jgi:hypothetical protein
MSGALLLPNEYWLSLQITPQDVENLHTVLFERETPLAVRDLCAEFIEARINGTPAREETKSSGKIFSKKNIKLATTCFRIGGSRARSRARQGQSTEIIPMSSRLMDDRSERMFAAISKHIFE